MALPRMWRHRDLPWMQPSRRSPTPHAVTALSVQRHHRPLHLRGLLVKEKTMDKFEASNGGTVEVLANGRMTVTDKTVVRLSENAERTGRTAYLDAEMVPTLREFFRAERDEELGRWRWPADSSYVAYPQAPECVRVVDERSGISEVLYRSGDRRQPPLATAGGMDVARAYFEAHPERKPWHEAKEGEVWLLMFPNSTQAWFVNGAYFQSTKTLTNIAKTDPGITAGRRIWPEVSDES